MDLRDLDICSIDPPGECLAKRSLACIHATFVLQDARILTTPCTLAVFPMGTLKRVSVSIRGQRPSTNLTATHRYCGRFPFCTP